jgi:hypothetical protein
MKKRRPITRNVRRKSPGRLAGAKGVLRRAAVSKRHPMFGALKGLICISPDTDLTDPAEPEWAAIAET